MNDKVMLESIYRLDKEVAEMMEVFGGKEL